MLDTSQAGKALVFCKQPIVNQAYASSGPTDPTTGQVLWRPFDDPSNPTDIYQATQTAYQSTVVGTDLAKLALDYQYQQEDGTLGGNGVEFQGTPWLPDSNLPSSVPLTDYVRQEALTLPKDGNGRFFIPSLSEVWQYQAYMWSGVAANDDASQSTTGLGSGKVGWLRVPGLTDTTAYGAESAPTSIYYTGGRNTLVSKQLTTSQTYMLWLQQDQTAITAFNSEINQGDSWSPADNFDKLIDMQGNEINDYNTAVAQGLEVDGAPDTSVPGTYPVTYKIPGFNGAVIEVTANVVVQAQASQARIEIKDSTLQMGSVWNAEDNFVSGEDENGNPLDFSALQVSGTVNTAVAGTYPVVYSYGGVSETAMITVLPMGTDNTKPGVDPIQLNTPGNLTPQPLLPVTPNNPTNPGNGNGNNNNNGGEIGNTGTTDKESSNVTPLANGNRSSSNNENRIFPETGAKENILLSALGLLFFLLALSVFAWRKKNKQQKVRRGKS